MKPRTLAILVLALVILAGLAVLNSKQKRSSSATEGATMGGRVLGKLDINQVTRITAESAAGTSVVERKEGQWVVSSLYYYPADFSVVADHLRLLDELTVGQVIRGGQDQLETFGLANGTNQNQRPLHINLLDDSGKSLAVLTVGIHRSGSADEPMRATAEGQYIRVDDGPVILVESTLDQFPQDSGAWTDRKLMDVKPDELTEIYITRDDSTLNLKVTGGGQYSIKDLGPDEHIELPAASRLAGALQSLYAINVADPSLGDKDLGFDQPARLIAHSQDGLVYTALVGGLTPDSNNRYARFKVEYNAPPAPSREQVAESLKSAASTSTNQPAEQISDQKINEELARRTQEYQTRSNEAQSRADKEHQRLRPWTYIIPLYSAQSLTLGREDLIKQTEKPENEKPKNDPS